MIDADSSEAEAEPEVSVRRAPPNWLVTATGMAAFIASMALIGVVFVGGTVRWVFIAVAGYAALVPFTLMVRSALFGFQGIDLRFEAGRAEEEIQRLRKQTEMVFAEAKGAEAAVRATEDMRSDRLSGETSEPLYARIAALEEENRTLRDTMVAGASIELGRAFKETAATYRRGARFWLTGLLLATALLGAASLYWVLERRIAQNATPAQIAAALASGAVMLGVPAYLVRVAANQFRSLQRLTVMAEGKAAILRTFSDVVRAHPDPAQVAALTERVSSSVFTVGDPGTVPVQVDAVNPLEMLASRMIERLK